MESDAWDARYAATELMWTAEPNRFVVEELVDLPPGRALDLAAGEGRNAVWLAAQGWRVTAVDFSGVAIERGRQLARQRDLELDWVVADVREYQPEAGYDLVLLAYLHIPAAELRAVLARAAGALAPGGSLLVVGHDRTNLDHGIGGPQDPAILHTPEEIVASLPGLRPVRADRARRPVDTDEGERYAIDTVVRLVQP